MLFLNSLLYTITIVTCCQSKPSPSPSGPKKDWWEHAQFYQIYPRSFKDSNGDGIGDLNGITEKLEYLKDIGITATWLSPIFRSPMVDFGYDISDFYGIQPEYGTMTDFENLLKKANDLGIKVILDFVPNHSSDENDWFKKSINREKGFEDFYVWHNGLPDPQNTSNRLPPSNWLSQFHGSSWEWNDKRQQFYLHQFAKQQPDLNYRNPAVHEQMRDVLKFWLDKGVAGFRVDAVPWCYEVLPDQSGKYPDEPKSGLRVDSNDEASLKHIYTQDQPETIDLVYEWRKFLDDYKREHGGDTRVLLIESWSPLNYTMKFYGNETVKGAQIPFNFRLIEDGHVNISASDLVKSVYSWMTQMPSNAVPNWVLGNHDKRRVSTRYGVQRIDIMEMMQMMLPGVSVTYMGEEIGMLDGEISWEQTKDPAALNTNASVYQKFTRDPERTPFQWDDSMSAGFSTNSSTWLPVESHYKKINVKKELADDRSHLKVFKALTNLRKTDTLDNGVFKMRAVNNDNVLIVERSLAGQSTYVLVANINSNTEQVNLKIFDPLLYDSLNVVIASVSSEKTIKDDLDASNIILGGFESVILRSKYA